MTSWMLIIWRRINGWVLCGAALAIVAELGQLFDWIPGTFDPWDLFFYCLGFFLPVVLHEKNYWSALALTVMAILALGSTESPPTNRNIIPADASLVDVEVIDVKIVQFKNAANGKIGQEVLTTWKNKGDKPVKVVYAEITAYFDDGSIKEQMEYTIYATFDDRPGVKPGETHRTKPGEGFKLTGLKGMPGYHPAAKAVVRVTRAGDKSGL
jgi:hypothetical protein